MNGQELREAFRIGKQVYGTLIMSTSPKWPERVKRMGLDFVFLDTEHVAIDREKLSWMCQLYHALNMAPIVRIPAPDSYLATMATDGGACGIMVPYVEHPDQVRRLVGAVKYRPLKGDKLARIVGGTDLCEPELQTYLDKNNEHCSLIIQIESVDGIEALDEILDVPGIDAILIGPHDLSCSLGVPEQYAHPLFGKTVRDIIQRVRRRSIGIGIQFSGDAEQMIDWGREGLHIFSHSADIVGFIQKVGHDIKLIKDGLSSKYTHQGDGVAR